MKNRVTVVSARDIPCRRETALAAVWNIKNIEKTEVKADGVEVAPRGATHGTYKVHGHFAGVPWRGEFAYELNDTGFHSRNAGVDPDRATIEGGFAVTPTAGGCTVIHYEQYVLPRRVRPLRFFIIMYLRWSMRRELRELERLVATEALRPT
jgi:hypothetical protein